jgi:hypothetical protein
MKGRYDNGLPSFSAKIKIGDEDGRIFGLGFLIWMSEGTKDVLSADRLFLCERSSRSWGFYTVSKSTLTFPRDLGVNDGIEHSPYMTSYWLSIESNSVECTVSAKSLFLFFTS